MLVIYKYPISIDSPMQILDIPRSAKVLTAQVQFDTICLWVLLDPSLACIKRYFHVVPTGRHIDDVFIDFKYINTFQLQGGALIFHVFEQLKSE